MARSRVQVVIFMACQIRAATASGRPAHLERARHDELIAKRVYESVISASSSMLNGPGLVLIKHGVTVFLTTM